MPEQLKISGLLLAAGASVRLGQAKQLLPWRTKTLVEHAAGQLLSLNLEEVSIVLGAYKQEVSKVLEPYPANLLFHPNYHQGMGSSLAFGLREILKNPQIGGVLVTLVDQPLIDRSYLKNMLWHFEEDSTKVVATSYDGRPGVPAVFPVELALKLKNIQGDSGAGKWLRHHPEEVCLMTSYTDTSDIDTLDDYQRMLKKSG